MSYIKKLTLNNFRNYESASLVGLSDGFVVLSGDNGAGKTNCLEAVSLLTPGKGLRNAGLGDIRLMLRRGRGETEIKTVEQRALGGVHAQGSTFAGQEAGELDVGGPMRWSVFPDIQSDTGTYRIGTGEDPAGKKRIAKINGEKIRALSGLSEHLACIWFTPNMSGLFLGGASERRRFFDRLVFAFDPAHAGGCVGMSKRFISVREF